MEAQNDGAVRKLARSRDNRWLGGVCGGLANYFKADAALFRVLFAILAFTGSGIPIYLVAWLIIPAEGQEESIGESLVRKARDGRTA